MRFYSLLSGIFVFLMCIQLAAHAQNVSIKPEIFAPGVVSTAEDELNATIAPDGKTLFFTRRIARRGVILISNRRGGKWSRPRVAAFSGRFSDFDPYFSADGKRLFFVSNRASDESAAKKDFDIWVVEKHGDGWSAPRNLGAPVNSAADELYPAPAANGALYFSSNRAGGFGGYDVYRAAFDGEKYGAPENLENVNSPVSEADQFTAPDESYMIFCAYNRPAGFGDGDLYVSFNRGGGRWSAPVNLGAEINSAAREYAPVASPDGKYLFYTSEKGFPETLTAEKPISFGELEKTLKSVANGRGNVYRVEIKALNLEKLKES